MRYIYGEKNDLKILFKYYKNSVDVSNIYISPYLLGCFVMFYNQHTIKLNGIQYDNYQIKLIHDIFKYHKHINHIYIDTHKNHDPKTLQYIDNMKCKYADLIYVLLLQKHCKNKFNISKNIIRYKIIPYIDIKN